jgi:N-acetylmuramoyl-L-alanine amidase
MPVDPARRSQRGGDRRALLQGVYDDNLKVLDREAAAPRRPPSAPKRRPSALSLVGGVGLLLLAFVLAGVFTSDARQEASGGVSAAQATPSVAAGQQAWELPEPRRRGERTTADLYGLEVRTIVLDPGHGGRDPGAIGPAGTLEKDVALEVAHRLRRRLERYPGYRILLTREEDTWVTKNDRAAFANDHGADLFISLHFNAIPDRAVASVETYYFGTTTDEATLRKVERENRESGYSMAEFREMVQRLATDIKLEESKRLATDIQASLYANTRLTNPAVRNWGVKTAPFVVLLGVKAPSVLAEIACISNPEEEARLNSPEHLENLAAFLEEGIVRYLQPSPSGTAPPIPAPGYATEEE